MKSHDLANAFRQERMRLFLEVLPAHENRKLRIVDIGGTASYWHALPGLYGRDDVDILIVNIGGEEFDDENLKVRRGDACDLSQFPDASFDVVHSNSVIEHVGLWPQMEAMAREVRRLAPRYFVQTPNYWFPIEPHFKLPFVQFMPFPLRARLRDAVWPGHSIELIGARQMRALFPDATIERERFAGLTKSIIAIRR